MRRFLVFTCALGMIANACSTGTTTYAGSPTSPDTGATESRYAGGVVEFAFLRRDVHRR